MRFNGNELRLALKSVKPALSKDDAKTILTGISFKLKDGICEIAACDGYRIHVKRLTYIQEPEIEDVSEFVIPFFDVPSGCNIVDITISKTEEMCSVVFDNGSSLILRTFREPYISYEKSVPKTEPVFSLVFNPKNLKDALINLKGPVNMDFYGDRSPCIIRTVLEGKDKAALDESYNLVLPCYIKTLRR